MFFGFHFLLVVFGQTVLNWGLILTPEGYKAVAGDTFDCHNCGEVCRWCLMGRAQ